MISTVSIWNVLSPYVVTNWCLRGFCFRYLNVHRGGVGVSVPVAGGLLQVWLSATWSALCLTAVCTVARLSAPLPIMCFYSWLSFWLSASIRAFKVTFSCIYEFDDFGVGGEFSYIWDVEIVQGFGVVICSLDEIVLCCHFFSFSLLLRDMDRVLK